jgi:hypothetical protein
LGQIGQYLEIFNFKTFREEILQIFELLVWKIDDFINSFGLYLTFSKKYSNRNYTHTLESSCLCQVAEINVALCGERAARARVQKSSSPGPTTNLVCLKM